MNILNKTSNFETKPDQMTSSYLAGFWRFMMFFQKLQFNFSDNLSLQFDHFFKFFNQIMKTRILHTLAFFVVFMMGAYQTQAQGIESVNYKLRFNPDSCWYDMYLFINSGDAVTADERTQYNAQITVLVPTGDSLIMQRNYMPLQNNQGYSGTLPTEWSVSTFLNAPTAMPSKDFYSITPSLSPASQFNDLTSGDSIKLFSFTVESYAACGTGVRLYENGTDPGSGDPGMGGGDFSNGYTIGDIDQLYNANSTQLYPPKPILLDPLVSCGVGITIDLTASTSTCQSPMTYAWTGPNYVGTSQDVTIFPALATDAGTYTVVVTDAIGCTNSVSVEVSNQPNAGPDYTICAGTSQVISGTQPTTGTWTALAGNPAGATMVPGTGGTATITFSNAASGVYTFRYSTSACYDDMTITVNPKPAVAITGSPNICALATTTLSPTSGGTWVANHPTVATVHATTGVVTGVAQGLATFTFTNTVTGCFSTTGNVNVSNGPAVSVASDSICIGSTTNLSPATGGTWTNFNPTIASLTSNYIVGGLTVGTAKFQFTEQGIGCKSDTIRVVVRPRPTVPATIAPLCINGTTNLTPTTGGTWTSAVPAVATISNSGLVTAVAAGTTTFIFTDAATACISDPTGTLTVHPRPVVGLNGTNNICLSGTRTLSPSTGGTWVSNNPAVATVAAATGVVTPVAAGLVTFTFTSTATGCSNTTNGLVINPPPTVGSGRDTICVGNTTTLSPVSGGTWAALNAPIASLSGTPLVTVTGISAGTATFRFTETSSGCQATKNIVVQARPIVTNPAPEICVGATTNVTPTTGGAWMTSQPGVASISNAGLITGISVGTASFTFTSTAGCASLPTAAVTVKNAPVVTLGGDPFICNGFTRQLTPSTGGTWVSSNPSVASVTSSGLVTANSAGIAFFTFTETGSGCSSSTGNLTVNLAPTITNSGASTICIGLTTTLNASTTGAWNALNPAIATISNTGVVSGVSAGVAGFTFTDGNGCTSATINVTVVAPTTVSVVGPTAICVGGTTQLNPTTGGSWAVAQAGVATVTPGGLVLGVAPGTASFIFTNTAGCISDPINSISINAAPTVSNGPGRVCVGSTITLSPTTGGTWVSNNASFATINATTGVVTGVAPGSVTFTFTSTIGCPSAPTSPVTVNNNPNAVLASSPICIGRTTTATPSVGGSWQSTSPSVASISNTGLITGLAVGTTTFIFTQTSTQCVSAPTTVLTVNAGAVITVPDNQLCLGETTTLTASPVSAGTWTSNAPLIASIHPTTGLVTALSAGIATFVFTDAGGCQSAASAPITVNPKPTVAISGNPFICIGATTQLSPATGGTWVSSNSAVATVNATGVVTGITAGTATFRFTDAITGCISDATLPVTVTAAPIVSITGPTTICINGTTTLSPNTGGTWTSNNIAVATVNPTTGVVTAVGPGTATFTFAENNTGCSSAAATDPITVTTCLNPDFNATFVNVQVPGDVSTNDKTLGSETYGPQGIIQSIPAGAVQTLTINSNGTYTFTGSMVGVYKYIVPVCSPPQTTGCPTADLWITVVDYLEPIRRPIANVDIATTAFNTPVILRTMENDDCEYVSGCTLNAGSVAIISNPTRGTATVNSSTGDITYTPNPTFSGLDTLVYTICVTGEPTNCAQAKQIITVNNSTAANSTAAADDFAVTAREVAVSGNVKLNDTDAEGNTQTVTAQTTTVAAGTLVLATDGSYTFTPAVDYFGPVDFPYTTCDNHPTAQACADATLHILVVPDLAVKVRVYLEGSLMNTVGSSAPAPDSRPLMRDNLRVSPFTGANYIPTSDPYKITALSTTNTVNVLSKFSHVAPGNRADFATIPNPSGVFAVTGQNAIVDWVWIELRSKTSRTTRIATRSALLQRDGDVVDLDGTDALRFPGIPMDDYHVIVRHHRHLGVMTLNAQTPTQLTTLVNFTKEADLPTWDYGTTHPTISQNYAGLSQKRNVRTGFMSMWGGDFDSNKKVKYENPNDDLNVLFFNVYAYPNNPNGNANYDFAYGYLSGDFDMNSKAKFDNPNDDKNMLFAQIIGYPLNAQSLLSNFDFLIEQLP
jgi:uncharacterized protein YjdB